MALRWACGPTAPQLVRRPLYLVWPLATAALDVRDADAVRRWQRMAVTHRRVRLEGTPCVSVALATAASPATVDPTAQRLRRTAVHLGMLDTIGVVQHPDGMLGRSLAAALPAAAHQVQVAVVRADGAVVEVVPDTPGLDAADVVDATSVARAANARGPANGAFADAVAALAQQRAAAHADPLLPVLPFVGGAAHSSATGERFWTDASQHRVGAVDAAGRVRWFGRGTAGYVDSSDAATAAFCWPTAVALEEGGTTLLVCDTLNDAIRRIDLATGAVSTVVPVHAPLSSPSPKSTLWTRLFGAFTSQPPSPLDPPQPPGTVDHDRRPSLHSALCLPRTLWPSAHGGPAGLWTVATVGHAPAWQLSTLPGAPPTLTTAVLESPPAATDDARAAMEALPASSTAQLVRLLPPLPADGSVHPRQRVIDAPLQWLLPGPARLRVRLQAPPGAAWVDTPAILRTALEGAAVTDDDVAIVAELATKTGKRQASEWNRELMETVAEPLPPSSNLAYEPLEPLGPHERALEVGLVCSPGTAKVQLDVVAFFRHAGAGAAAVGTTYADLVRLHVPVRIFAAATQPSGAPMLRTATLSMRVGSLPTAAAKG